MDEDFAINRICPKFLSLLLTEKTCIGVAEKGSLKIIFVSVYSKVVNNKKSAINILRTYRAYAESTLSS